MPNITNSNSVSSSAQIVDGIIVDADVAAGAAIAKSKLSGVAGSGANSDITSLASLSTPLSVAQGGTGKATIATGALIAGNGTGVPTEIALGSSAQVLTSNGAGVPPTFQGITPPTFANGSALRDISTASGNQTIAHGLARTPKYIQFDFLYIKAAGQLPAICHSKYNGTTQSEAYIQANATASLQVSAADNTNFVTILDGSGLGHTGTVTFDGTNITIAWTKVGSITGNIMMTWFAV